MLKPIKDSEILKRYTQPPGDPIFCHQSVFLFSYTPKLYYDTIFEERKDQTSSWDN
jgi:hypothetical protein